MRAMTRLAAILLLVAVTACGGSSKKVTDPGVTGGKGDTTADVADPIPTTKGPECAIVADKLATVAYAETPDLQPEARDKLRTRCADDTWSDEARNCFAAVETDAEIDGCNKLLTDAQRAALRKGVPPMGSKDPWGSGTLGDAPEGGTSGTGPVPTGTGTGSGAGGGTRGPKRDSSDPCEGGERK